MLAGLPRLELGVVEEVADELAETARGAGGRSPTCIWQCMRGRQGTPAWPGPGCTTTQVLLHGGDDGAGYT